MFTRKNNLLVLLFFNFTLICFSQTEFITTWAVTAGDLEITIPTNGTSNIYNVVWGDGNSDIGTTGDASHTYGSPGTYTVTITGNFRRIFFDGNTGDMLYPGNKEKIISVEQWGSAINWSSMFNAFRGCTNLVINATDTPNLSSVGSMQRMFNEATSIGTGSSTVWNLWDTSNITNMSNLFRETSFNKDISGWNTLSVTNMASMFYDSPFNQNIGGWNVSSVTNMAGMFRNNNSFNQNIGGWNVSSVTNMSLLFRGASAFNQDLNSWTTTSLTNTSNMFRDATAFNGNITSWNMAAVTSMERMFNGASNFNQNIGGWNTTLVTDMSYMFNGASAFNQDLNSWIVSSVTDMINMFNGATSFNGNITSWNTAAVTNMTRMFNGATSFNQNIGSWNTTLVTNMSFMFNGATSFNQNIGSWTVNSVVNMDEMFRDATAFNQNLNSWNVTSVTNMNEMFRGATSFNGNISSWVPSSVIIMSSMFRDASNFNQNIGGWNIAAVTNLNSMFYNASSFNQDIGSWTVNNVVNMASMFRGATNFNQNISGWNVAAVTTMSSMFRDASSFNQDIGGWTTSSLENLSAAFRNGSFDQNIGGWNVTNVTNVNNIFRDSKLSVANYNALLVGWNAQSLQPGESFHAGSSRYCSPAAIAAKANMENPGGDNWSFTDGGVLTSFVWTGTTDTDWNDNTNWQDGFDNDCTLDVTIPSVTNHPVIDASSEFTVDNLTIDAGASLIIEGGLTVEGNLTTNDGLTLNSGGSIIVDGTSTGNLTYNRSLANADEYYYVSPPLEGETIEDYITNNTTLSTGNGNVGLFYYDNNTTSGFLGSGFIFYQPASTGSFTSARGYGTQLNAAGDITFTGTMPTNNVSISISEGTMGDINPNPDNFIGNPFPSYVAVNLNAAANPNNLLNSNSSILSEQTIWLWDNTMNDYVPKNQGSAAFYVAPGQGFFVSSTSSGGTFNFLESWQSHLTPDVFFKTSSDPFRIKLTLKNNKNKFKFTEVYFIQGTSNQFDNGYDSSKLNEDNNLDIYTRLVDDTTNKNLSIQSLPNNSFDTTIIPLGITSSGINILNLSTTNKPQGVFIYLEDREKNTFTKLTDTSNLELNLGKSSNGIGRFYLHTKIEALNIPDDLLNDFTVYLDHKELVINGDIEKNSSLTIFDVLGKQILSKKNLKTNRIDLKILKKGVYFIQLKTEKGMINKSILLK